LRGSFPKLSKGSPIISVTTTVPVSEVMFGQLLDLLRN
jgi:hypothetical protein